MPYHSNRPFEAAGWTDQQTRNSESGEGPSTSIVLDFENKRTYLNAQVREPDSQIHCSSSRLNMEENELSYLNDIEVANMSLRQPNVSDSVMSCPSKKKSVETDESERLRRNFVICDMHLLDRYTPFHQNKMQVRGIVDKIRKTIPDPITGQLLNMKTKSYSKRLGPKACRLFIALRDGESNIIVKDEKLKDGIVKMTPPDSLERKGILLSNPKAETNVVAIEQYLASSSTFDQTWSEILHTNNTESDAFDVCVPGENFGIRFEYGKKIKLIKNRESTRFAHCCDDIKENCDPQTFYEEKFGCKIKMRKMTIIERKQEKYIPRQLHYLVEFGSLKDKQKCMGKYTEVSQLVGEGSDECNKKFESLSMRVSYDAQRHANRIAIVEIENGDDLHIAEKIIQKHQMVTSLNDDRYGKKDKNLIFVSQLPHQIITNKGLFWLFGRILNPNNISFKRAHFKPIVYRGRIDVMERSAFNVLSKKLLLSCKMLNLWDGPDFDILDGTLSKVLEERLELPWTIRDKGWFNSPDAFGGRTFDVLFYQKNVHTGNLISCELLRQCSREDKFLQFNEKQLTAVRVRPRYRQLIAVSRSVRIAVDSRLIELDKWLRSFPENYMKENPEAFAKDNMDLIFFRIIDENDSDSDMVLVGIEGWSPEMVNCHMEKVKKEIEPKVIDCSTNNDELLYGVGEAYVNNVVKSYNGKVVVDIDRFKRKIYVFGSESAAACYDILEYKARKSKLVIETKITVASPFYNDNIRKFLSKNILQDIAHVLNARIEPCKDHTLKYKGSIKSYHDLLYILKTIDRHIFEQFCNVIEHSERKKLLADVSCPICLDRMDYDFYRLEKCGHSLCRKCLNGLIKHSIETYSFPCKCPFQCCEMFIAPSDLKNIIMGDASRVKSLDSMKLAELRARSMEYLVMTSNKDIGVCPTPNCESFIMKSINRFEKMKKCSKCDWKYCPQCLLEYHEDTYCEEYEKIREDVDFSLNAYKKSRMEEGAVQKCPTENCKAVIEKEDGCNHVQCLFCKIHFCWLCASYSSMSSGDIYRHMSDDHGGAGGGWVIEGDNLLQTPDNALIRLEAQIQHDLFL